MKNIDSWQVKFNFHGKGIDCDIELSGNKVAIQTGIQLAVMTVQDKFQELYNSGDVSVVLAKELMIVDQITQGNFHPFAGKYLTVTQLEKQSAGLVSSVSIVWQ
jgi:hypothetical protein